MPLFTILLAKRVSFPTVMMVDIFKTHTYIVLSQIQSHITRQIFYVKNVFVIDSLSDAAFALENQLKVVNCTIAVALYVDIRCKIVLAK
jgi:hypothetical protein